RAHWAAGVLDHRVEHDVELMLVVFVDGELDIDLRTVRPRLGPLYRGRRGAYRRADLREVEAERRVRGEAVQLRLGEREIGSARLIPGRVALVVRAAGEYGRQHRRQLVGDAALDRAELVVAEVGEVDRAIVAGVGEQEFGPAAYGARRQVEAQVGGDHP